MKKMKIKLILSLFPLVFYFLEAFAAPKVGLVLGGGGARGFAHIGILKFLEEERIQIDCLAGTSMGALVASAWNAGVSPKEMEQELSKVNWADMFDDFPDYAEMSAVKRRLAYDYLSGSEVGITKEGLHYPPGMVSGQKIKLFFNHLLKVKKGERLIENLPLPLVMMATDIVTGKAIELKKGRISEAMRASMSVPGLLAPVEYEKYKLVDGGLVDNLPIVPLKKLCQADVIIAVNVGSPLLPAEKVNSFFGVTAQMVNILTEQNVKQSLKHLNFQKDIYLKPPLENISAADFSKIKDIVQEGYDFVFQQKELFLKLKSNVKEWEKWHAKLKFNAPDLKINQIEVLPLNHVNPKTALRFFENQQHFNESQIEQNIQRTYADGFYENVDYTVLKQHHKNILRILPAEKSWGTDYLRFALHLRSSSQEGSRFHVKAAYHKTWLNQLGGEFLSEIALGDQWHFKNVFYQPLNAQQNYFTQLEGMVMRENIALYQNNHKEAEYAHNQSAIQALLGKNWNVLGDSKVGFFAKTGHFSRRIGSGQEWLSQKTYKTLGALVDINWEQFDRLYFPRKGYSFKMRYFDSFNHSYSRFDLEAKTAVPIFSKTIWSNRVQYVSSPYGKLPYFDSAYLGGFQNMSALSPYALWGDNLIYIGSRMERILGEMPFGKSDLRLGLMLEAAKNPNGYARAKRPYVDSLALYLGGETFLGPAFLGLAYSNALHSYNAFLFLGMP